MVILTPNLLIDCYFTILEFYKLKITVCNIQNASETLHTTVMFEFV